MPVCLCLWLQISEAGSQFHMKAPGAGLGEKSRWMGSAGGGRPPPPPAGPPKDWGAWSHNASASFSQREYFPKNVGHGFKNTQQTYLVLSRLFKDTSWTQVITPFLY